MSNTSPKKAVAFRRRLRQTLLTALKGAGVMIRRDIDRPKTTSFKNGSPINLVTTVDQAADRYIRRIIHQRFPSHDLLTEESTATSLQSPFKWIVDPIDGTTNFAHSFPQCVVSIGVEEEGTVTLAGVYDPLRDELFFAEKGRGALLITRRLKRRIHVSDTPTLSKSLLITGFPYDRRERADFYLTYVKMFMGHIQGIRRLGAAALDLCWIACGRADGYWEWRLKPWDSAAGKLIVEEAGGRLTNFEGEPFSIYGDQTLASNGRIHAEMLKVMGQAKRLASRLGHR